MGLPRLVWRGEEPVSTGIFKEPVVGRVKLRTLNLDGDRQADLSVHGGPEKAVYLYPSEHYEFWKRELPDMDMPWGMFGENFTVTGLSEEQVRIGDQLEVGSALFAVTQPRMPCYKLGLKFGQDDILKRFLQSGRSGFYLSVLKEGEVAAGDSIKLTGTDTASVTVSDITLLYKHPNEFYDLRKRAADLPALPKSWRAYFNKQLSS